MSRQAPFTVMSAPEVVSWKGFAVVRSSYAARLASISPVCSSAHAAAGPARISCAHSALTYRQAGHIRPGVEGSEQRFDDTHMPLSDRTLLAAGSVDV